MSIKSIRKSAAGVFTILTIGVMSAFAQNSLVLHVDRAQDTIQKTIYGGLMENWFRDVYDGLYVGTKSTIPNTNGIRNDIIEALKEMQLGVMQWPGGCFAETYKWYLGIDGMKDDDGRTITKESREAFNRDGWGQNIVEAAESYGFDTDEYFQLCEMVGCAPFIQANCRSASAATMRAWLEYINEKYPDKLKFLGMGNEPWGGCWGNAPQINGKSDVNSYINEWYNPFNDAIPEAFIGKITRIGAAGHSDSRTINAGWTTEVVRRCVGKMEGLSWHYYTTQGYGSQTDYPCINFGESDYYAVLDLAYKMEPQARKVMDIMDQYDPDMTISLQPDEVGVWIRPLDTRTYGNSFQQMTMREAQVTAQHLNFFNNNCKRIRMAQFAQPVNAIHSFFLTHPRTGELVKTPAFYTYKLYVPHHNARMVPSELRCDQVRNLNTLNTSASLNSEGFVHVSVSNIHASQPRELTMTIEGGGVFDSISGEILNGSSFNSYNDFGKAEAVNIKEFAPTNYSLDGNEVSVTLPAHSVVMLKLHPHQVGTLRRMGSVADTRFDVVSLPDGRIKVQHDFADGTPIAVSLFTVNGRLVAPTFSTVTEGADSFVWEPVAPNLGDNTYIMKVSANGVTRSERVVLHSAQ